MEQALGKTTSKELLPAQPGDVEATYADIDTLVTDTGYSPKFSIQQGLQKFTQWYVDYYAKNYI
jgi:UDP-glucuronate 4-epimerase